MKIQVQISWVGQSTRFHLTFQELREQRCQSSNRGGKVPIPKSPHYNFFLTETVNTFTLRSEKWINHWRLKLWSLPPSRQILQTRKSPPWAFKYDGQLSFGMKSLLNCQKQVMYQKSNLEMQKAVTQVNQFKPFFPQAVPKRHCYADFRRFARMLSIFMRVICIFTHFCANLSKAESTC